MSPQEDSETVGGVYSKRRQFMQAVGIAGAVGVAGCLGGEDDGTDDENGNGEENGGENGDEENGDPGEAVFAVSGLDPADAEIEEGETLDVEATITNTGDAEGTQTVEYRVDDEPLASEDLTLEAVSEETVSFEGIDTEELESGEHTHGVYTEDAEETGTLTVEELRLPDDPQSVLELGDLTAISGSTTTITGQLSNPYGFEITDGEVSLEADDDAVELNPVSGTTFDTLDAYGSQDVEWELTVPDTEDEYEITATTTYSGPQEQAEVSTTISLVTSRWYQAEDADEIVDSVIDSNHDGHNGDGFLNFDAPAGARAVYEELPSTIEEPGLKLVRVRYALADDFRTVAVTVNDEERLQVPFTRAGTEWDEWGYASFLVELGGDDTLAFETIGEEGPNMDQLMLADPWHQAEDGELIDTTVDSDHDGYFGSGFVNFDAEEGAQAVYENLTDGIEEPGRKTLLVRYALGGDPRPIALKVNDTTRQVLNFTDSGGWASWGILSAAVELESGDTIAFETIGHEGPNVDQVAVVDDTFPLGLHDEVPLQYGVNLGTEDREAEEIEANAVEVDGLLFDDRPDPAIEPSEWNASGTDDEIEGTDQDWLFQNMHWGEDLGYEISIAPGTYEVTLYFAETFHEEEGARVFDVSVQGQPVLEEFDPVAEAGHGAAHSETVEVDVVDGTLTIESTSHEDNSLFSGIEIRDATEPLERGLEAHFPLDGDAPTNEVTGADAEIVGEPSSGVEGVVGSAWEFGMADAETGVADAVVSEPLSINGEGATVGAWVNVADFEEWGRAPFQVGGTPEDFPDAGWGVEWDSADSALIGQLSTDGEPGRDDDSGTIPLDLETWYFVVMVVEGDGYRLHAFDESGELEASPATGSASGGRTQSAEEPLVMMAGDGRETAGRLDEVWAYSRALPEADVQQLYAKSRSDDGSEDWDLEGETDVTGEGYAGAGHWVGENFHVYEFGLGVDGADAPTAPSDDDDQFYWTAADYDVGDTPDDAWEPLSNVDTWEIQEDDDGKYLELGGPNDSRTNLRFAAGGQAAEMNVRAKTKGNDDNGDYYLYLRGQNEDDSGTMNAVRIDDEALGDRNRLSQYNDGDWGLLTDMDYALDIGSPYEVRGRVAGQTVNAKWELVGGDE